MLDRSSYCPGRLHSSSHPRFHWTKKVTGPAASLVPATTRMTHRSSRSYTGPPYSRAQTNTTILTILVLCVQVQRTRCWESVDHYKSMLGVGVGLPNKIATQHSLNQVRDECLEALTRLASEWTSPNTRVGNLVNPGYAFRTHDQPPRPTQANLRDIAEASLMWYTLLSRIMNGDWIDPSWKTLVLPPWTMEHLCYRFKLQIDGNIEPDTEDLCIPFNSDLLPDAQGPLHTRHNLAAHRDGYIMVYLGTDHLSRPLQVPLHAILALAFHGPPNLVAETGRMQEVAHTCNHPWCINPRHLRWCSHAENCNQE